MKASMIIDARDYAVRKHWGQMYGDLPYIVHLEQVAAVCKEFGLPTIVQVAAYLHDILEDTNTTASELVCEFGYDVATLVYSVTDGEGKNRKERKENTYHKTASNPHGIYLKLADRIANVRASNKGDKGELLSMYKKEAISFKKALHKTGIAENMWQTLTLAYKGD